MQMRQIVGFQELGSENYYLIFTKAASMFDS